MKISNGITHPAISKVACPHCRSAQGVPCTNREFPRRHTGNANYVKTHTSRIKRYRETFSDKDIAFIKSL